MYTWKDYKTLHRIPEGISRWANERTLYSVRCNSENAIEYTTEKPYESLPSFSCPFKTSAGFVILKNRGEFGGGLQIGC